MCDGIAERGRSGASRFQTGQDALTKIALAKIAKKREDMRMTYLLFFARNAEQSRGRGDWICKEHIDVRRNSEEPTCVRQS